MIREFFIDLERWMLDDESALIGFAKFMLVFVIAFAIICAPFAYVAQRSEESAQSQCIASGRGWGIIGAHEGLMPVGKVLVPHTYTDYGCLEVKRP